MAVIQGYIQAKAPTRQQISKAYKEFADLTKSRTKNIDQVLDSSIFNTYHNIVVGNLMLQYDCDSCRTTWDKNGRAERTIAVKVLTREPLKIGYQYLGTINLLKVIFFANGIQDDIIGLVEVDDIQKLIKENTLK